MHNLRNIAIIAHIDHGKTTLLDSLLKQSNIFRSNQIVEERMMDSYDQEKERGITIFAKHTAVEYKDCKINIIDTPGHADFSCEVERTLGMTSSVLLLVDAQEGPMPQTRFVLSKALKMGLKPIVVINKIDKSFANPDRALDLTFDLFVELGAHDEQLDFPYCFASGIGGFAMKEIDDERTDMKPLLDMIVEHVPPPSGSNDKPFLMQVSSIHYDEYLGRKACGKIDAGVVKKGDTIFHMNDQGEKKRATISKIETFLGLQRIEVEEATTGDIVLLAGISDITISDTLSSDAIEEALPSLSVGEPTLSIDISVNSSPFSGRSGKYLTANKLRERLEKEKEANVSLKISFCKERTDTMSVAGRGELHLSVLIEQLRREGYELSISKPRVLFKKEEGVLLEPEERVYIEVPEEFSGQVIEELSRRRGEMQHFETNEQGITQLEFLIPTRGLMGYRGEFLTATRGLGILTSLFEKFVPFKGEIVGRRQGVMIASMAGKATGYASFTLQNRGTLFTEAQQDVYEGMIVGEHSRDNDLVVNITKEKQLTNVRASGSDENIILSPPRRFTLEEAIAYIEDDELVEVTPDSIRLRKIFLNETDRKREERAKGR